ncbi:CDGSH iron-sulfur domain-containing protein [Thiohalobacter sp.]|uniref:CDGSH iron-sulfur domain-containing protein n=1 Tax=Thiohalobacter sp. TaxID=2025948 RepID=UPI00262833F6|nr:CDGSH iron-sulfur domain-containing protein [Thiohalobacter sp.]
MTTTIRLRPNGPLYIDQPLVIELPDGSRVERPGDTALCRCGHTGTPPFCDGSHRVAGFADPGHVEDEKAEVPGAATGPLQITVRRNAMLIVRGPVEIVGADGSCTTRNKAALCRCGQSGNRPFCDASHRRCGFAIDGEADAGA